MLPQSPGISGISAPMPIRADLDLESFSCGKPPLDDWLRHNALRSEGRSARSYVVCREQSVIGYYCFASGAVRREELPKRRQRNMPNIIPVFLIGRLAVDGRLHGLGIGKGLLKDALGRALTASEIVGSNAVMVHAIDDEAARFYRSLGFEPLPESDRTFFMPIATIAAAYGA